MKKVLVDEQEFVFNKENLPVLIHGEDHAGASFYTINMVAQLFSRGFRVVVLCGYPMAEEQFQKEASDYENKVSFYTQEKVEDFKKVLGSSEDECIFLIKNVELFGTDVLVPILKKKSYIISGDINKCVLKEELEKASFKTKIYFSKTDGMDLPDMNKYEGFLVSDEIKGTTRLII